MLPVLVAACLIVLLGAGCHSSKRNDAPNAEYVEKFGEYVVLLKQNFATIREEFKAGNRAEEDYIEALERYDLGRLALQRLKTGRDAESTFVDVLIQVEMAERTLAKANRDFQHGTIPPSDVLECRLTLIEAELELFEALKGVEPGAVQTAVEIIKGQSDEGLSDAQIAELVELEPAPRGR